MNASEKYNEQYAEIENQLSVLKVKLKKNKACFEKVSNNWAYVGSISQINVLLKEINLFLGE
jgi:hypothetical protein